MYFHDFVKFLAYFLWVWLRSGLAPQRFGSAARPRDIGSCSKARPKNPWVWLRRRTHILESGGRAQYPKKNKIENILKYFKYFLFFKIYFLYHQIKIIQKHQKILILSKKNKKISNFLKAFLKSKNKHALIRKFTPTSNEKKIIITYFLYNIKKISSIYFLFPVWKKKIKEEEKKFKEEKNKIENIYNLFFISSNQNNTKTSKNINFK